jgi:TolB-like protein/tetratricopeptide (TPR) repeat protein
MKKIVCIVISFLIIEIAISQPMRIAILDFDNISGIAKYDGLGKAMSSMLISDIESNVSPKRLQLVERAQINKIMKEQNLQKSTSFDKNTSVKMGKLLGVNFLLIGDIYILDNSLVINARLTDASSGDIKFSEKQEGKINEWLTVKSKLGKSVSTSISMPFIQPRIPDGIISTAVLTTYASAIDENDKGNFEKAETLISTAKEFDPGFDYLDDLKNEVEKLKKQMAEIQKELEISVSDPIATALNFYNNRDFVNCIKYFKLGLSRIPNSRYGEKYAYFLFLAEAYFENKDFGKSINYCDSVLELNPYEQLAIKFKSGSLVKTNKIQEGISLIQNLIDNYDSCRNPRILFKSLYEFLKKNNTISLQGLSIVTQTGQLTLSKRMEFESYNEFCLSLGNHFTCSFIDKLEVLDNYEFVMGNKLAEVIIDYTNLLADANISNSDIAIKLEKIKTNRQEGFSCGFIEKPRTMGGYVSANLIKDGYVLCSTGQPYTGPVTIHYTSCYIIYSKGSTNDCPCEQLIKVETYNETKSLETSYVINDDNLTITFNSAWFNILAKEYNKAISKYKAIIAYFNRKKTILDLNYFSEEFANQFKSNTNNFSNLQFCDLEEKDKDFLKMTYVNLGHSYLLSSDFNNAFIYYSDKILKINFGSSFENISPSQAIQIDWNDFIEKGLVTKSQLTDFNNKFKIISNF